MNPIKFVWKNLGTRIWLIVTVVLIVLFLTVTLVATQSPFIRGTFNLLLGGDRPIIDESTEIYTLDEGLTTSADVLAAANELNEEIAAEGMILLKNEGNALPMKTEKNVTVFGKNSVDLIYGGTGSGDAAKADSATIYDSLEAAGFTFNPVMKEFYENDEASGAGRPCTELMGQVVYGLATGENPNGYDSVRSSYAEYNDAAIVVISRAGGEGFDLPRTMRTSALANAGTTPGARSATDHYLQLDANEEDMLQEACANFDKVVLVLNTAQVMELGFLYADSGYNALKGYDIDADKIQAAVWMGLPGTTGVMALGRILNGTVNPSGHTTDTWATDFTADPSYRNFGSNNVLNGNRYKTGSKTQDAYFIDYEEGIYVGYKYYETRGVTDGEEWYDDNVLYPFGYGLGYSDFTWTVSNISHASGSTLGAEDVITVTVSVHNDGDVPGKDVVQLYYEPPYNPKNAPTAIEKSAVVLGDFAKTEEIPAGESREVTLTLKVSDMKSYDYNDANKNETRGYELEAGDYGIKIAKDAHDEGIAYDYHVAADVIFATDEATGYEVVNRFDDVSSGIDTYMSRADWEGTFPTTPTDADREVTEDFIESLIWKKNDAGQPWETKNMPPTGTGGGITFTEMAGVPYDDPKWMELVRQLTVSEMAAFIGSGAYQTARLDKIGKPMTVELDGPSGWADYMGEIGVNARLNETCFYVAECVMGATWNRDLARRMGQMVGNEALTAMKDGTPLSGWYAPGVNIHRSPFAGRNWEYYGEDGYLTGALASEVVLGAKEKGVVTYVKHFALNDSETNRDFPGTDAGNNRGLGGLLVWANEQSMRELYFKPFEMTVKIGGTNGMMSGFNRLGTVWVGGSYNAVTEVLRNEWGFEGTVITDYGVYNFVNEDQMIRAGGDLRLNQSDPPTSDASDATQVASMQRAVKNILYTAVQSNILNVKISGYLLPVWIILLIVVDIAVVVGCAVWGTLIILFTKKKLAKQQQ